MSKDEKMIKVFEYALNQEETGKSFFEVSLRRMGVGAAVSAFERLIREEEGHILFIKGILQDLREKHEPNLSVLGEMVLEPTNYFDARTRSEFLEQCVKDAMIPDVAVFNTAWLIERDLSDFYRKMASKAEDTSKKSLTMLAKWEKSHEKFFRAYRDKLSDLYAKMPWGG